MWLSGLSASLWNKGSLVRFPVREHAWVVGQVPSWGAREATIHWCFAPSLPPNLSLKINKISLKKKKEYKKCFSSLINEKSTKLLQTLLTSNPSLWRFSTAGVGASGRDEAWKKNMPYKVQGLQRKLGKQTLYTQSTCEDRATTEEWRVLGKCRVYLRSLVSVRVFLVFWRWELSLLCFRQCSKKKDPWRQDQGWPKTCYCCPLLPGFNSGQRP